MSSFNNVTRRTADKIEALLQKMSLIEQSLPRPITLQNDVSEIGITRMAVSLRSAKRAYIANSHALRSTDALLEQIYP